MTEVLLEGDYEWLSRALAPLSGAIAAWMVVWSRCGRVIGAERRAGVEWQSEVSEAEVSVARYLVGGHVVLLLLVSANMVDTLVARDFLRSAWASRCPRRRKRLLRVMSSRFRSIPGGTPSIWTLSSSNKPAVYFASLLCQATLPNGSRQWHRERHLVRPRGQT